MDQQFEFRWRRVLAKPNIRLGVKAKERYRKKPRQLINHIEWIIIMSYVFIICNCYISSYDIFKNIIATIDQDLSERKKQKIIKNHFSSFLFDIWITSHVQKPSIRLNREPLHADSKTTKRKKQHYQKLITTLTLSEAICHYLILWAFGIVSIIKIDEANRKENIN